MQLVESKCLMKLTFPTENIVTIENAFSIEFDIANYFDELLITPPEDGRNLLRDIKPLQFQVDVADRIAVGKMATITAAVTLLYETSGTAEPLEMAAILTESLGLMSAVAMRNFTDRKSTRLNSSHRNTSRMPSSA